MFSVYFLPIKNCYFLSIGSLREEDNTIFVDELESSGEDVDILSSGLHDKSEIQKENSISSSNVNITQNRPSFKDIDMNIK